MSGSKPYQQMDSAGPEQFGLVPWQHGLCECFEDVDACLDVCFCPCFQMGRQFDAADASRADSVNWFVCVVALFSTVFAVVANAYVRNRVRVRFGLDEHICETMCKSVLCPWCSAVQTHRELNARALFPGGTCCVPDIAVQAPPPPAYLPMGAARSGYGTL